MTLPADANALSPTALPPVARWPLRLMAAIMDCIYAMVFSGILVIIVWVAVADVGTFQAQGLTAEQQQEQIRQQAASVMAGGGGLAIVLSLLALNLLYWVLSAAGASLRGTLGKKLFGLAVLRPDGRKLSLGQALLRGTPMLIMGVLFLLATLLRSSPLSYAGLAVWALLVLDLGLSAVRPDSRGIGDLLAGSNVHRVRMRQPKARPPGREPAPPPSKGTSVDKRAGKKQSKKAGKRGLKRDTARQWARDGSAGAGRHAP